MDQWWDSRRVYFPPAVPISRVAYLCLRAYFLQSNQKLTSCFTFWLNALLSTLASWTTSPFNISFLNVFFKSATWQKWPYSTSGLDSSKLTPCVIIVARGPSRKMPFQRFYPRHIVGVYQMPRWDFPFGKTWKQQMGSAFLKPSQANEAVRVICLVDKLLWNWMRRCTCNSGKWVWPKVFLT